MCKDKNYSIGVEYELYTILDDQRELAEKTEQGDPFRFITGFGMTLEAFEANVSPLNEGDSFDFTLTVAQAYGEHVQERVIDLDKNLFIRNGKFDEENIQIGNIVPLQNADGQQFLAQVLDITADKVLMDLNHPLAGKSLNFVGKVVEKREATPKEIEAIIAHLTGGGCGGCGGGNCGNCGEGGGCGEGGCCGGGGCH